MAAPWRNEDDVKGALFKISGGGTLWQVPGQHDKLYKRVDDADELSNIVRLFPQWQRLAGSDWMIPEALVCSSHPAAPVGYIMQRAAGTTLADIEGAASKVLDETLKGWVKKNPTSTRKQL